VTPSEWDSRSVRANGQRIHVHIAGSSGPIVLLCHGFPESWYSWRHQLDALASAGFRAVAMDMRGYGRSSKPTEVAAYRITELVADCVGVVRALGESTAVIVGHDFGAPVAWTAAWTRPDVFRAVVGLSVPFGGRGVAGLPGSPFGEVRPSVAHRKLAGPDMLFYQEYFSQPGDLAAREVEEDLRGWLTAGLYSLSADRPLPPELVGIDLTSLPEDMLREVVRAVMCVPRGSRFADLLQQPEKLPSWLGEDDVDYYVSELAGTRRNCWATQLLPQCRAELGGARRVPGQAGHRARHVHRRRPRRGYHLESAGHRTGRRMAHRPTRIDHCGQLRPLDHAGAAGGGEQRVDGVPARPVNGGLPRWFNGGAYRAIEPDGAGRSAR
jgi:pimeloyl-ACP methyl ester carboxylesterase